jgi:sugar-specific transcriptional regulator TrmB
MDNELRQLGLTPNEIKIYNTLLEIGENTVGPIIKKLSMHRQVAYDALEGLENKKMAVSTTKNNRAYYRVADPKNILDNIHQQEFIAKSLVHEINQKLAGQKKGQEIRVYEGEKTFRELTMRNDDLQPKNSEYLVVTGAAKRFTDIMNISGVFQRSNKIRQKKNIKTKTVFSNLDRKEVQNVGRTNSEYRFLEEGYHSPTAFAIWHDSINLISYGEEVFCIEIKNKDFCQAYRNYFNLLWKIAKK